MILRPAQRMDGIERTLIRRIFDNAPPDAINLGLGQPDLATPCPVALAGVAAIAHGRTGYTSTAGDPELREAIARRYEPFASGPQNVVVTVGSQEAMFAACLALTDPGDEILYPDPGYPAYPAVARLTGARAVSYPLSAEVGFRIQTADIERRITPRTRLVIVSEPSNPTGACSEASQLTALSRLLESRGIPWVSDEIYAGFSYENEFVSLSRLSASGLVISGLSKDMSMTGWRVGWVVGDDAVIGHIIAAHQYLVTCAPSLSQSAALSAFGARGRAEAQRYLKIFSRRRDLMAHELEQIDGIRFVPPQGAFYYFVDVSAFGACEEIAGRILERRNVVTIPGIAFGPGGAGFLRLSFAASEENIRQGVRAIGDELRSGA